MAAVKSPIAAQRVGTAYHNLIVFIRTKAIPAQARDSSGHYLWSEDDIKRARQAMADRRRRRNRAPAAP